MLLTALQWFVLRRFDIDHFTALMDALVSNAILALASLGIFQLFRFYKPGKGYETLIYRLVTVVSVTALSVYALRLCLYPYVDHSTAYHIFISQSMPLRYVFTMVMLGFVSGLIHLWNRADQHTKQQLRQSEVEQLHKEAELIRLRQQLQPHFLFNSLNSISALAGSNPTLARQMIQQLSDFYRGTLKKDEDQTVALSEELKHLSLYLDIEKIRFGERLHVNIFCDEGCGHKKIPPLLLQPIVENAIKFGLYGTIDSVHIRLEASCRENLLHVKVTNPFDNSSQTHHHGTGFGLSFIQRRLFLLYAQNNLLRTNHDDHTFTTEIFIPQ